MDLPTSCGPSGVSLPSQQRTSMPMEVNDLFWLLGETPTNLMVINSILIFEKPVSKEQTMGLLRILTEKHFRFTALATVSKWQRDPNFLLSAHLLHVRLPEPGGDPELFELLDSFVLSPLDPTKPLWKLYLIDGYKGQGTVILLRVHHCIADGIALVKMLFTLCDEPAVPLTPSSKPETTITPTTPATETITGTPTSETTGTPTTSETTSGTKGRPNKEGILSKILNDPEKALETAKWVVGGLSDLLAWSLLKDDRNILTKEGPRSVRKRLAWTKPIPLDHIKKIKDFHKTSLNDAIMCILGGALGRLIEKERRKREEEGTYHDRDEYAVLRVGVPVNVRAMAKLPETDELGNHFALVMIPLPVDEPDHTRRLKEVVSITNYVKASAGPIANYYISRALTHVRPMAIGSFLRKLLADKLSCLLTNVPGPQVRVRMAGQEVHSIMFWAPIAAHLGLSLSVFSYGGSVVVGVSADPNVIANVNDLTDMYLQVFEEMYKEVSE